MSIQNVPPNLAHKPPNKMWPMCQRMSARARHRLERVRRHLRTSSLVAHCQKVVSLTASTQITRPMWGEIQGKQGSTTRKRGTTRQAHQGGRVIGAGTAPVAERASPRRVPLYAHLSICTEAPGYCTRGGHQSPRIRKRTSTECDLPNRSSSEKESLRKAAEGGRKSAYMKGRVTLY